MIPVQIKYSFLNRFKRTIKRQVPGSWNELTGEQYVKIVSLLFTPLTEAVQKYRLLGVLLGMSPVKMFGMFSTVQAAQLLALTNFIFADNTLTRQLLPKFRLKIVSFELNPFRIRIGRPLWLYGPGDGLKNITYDELIFADGLFLSYFHTGDVESLNKFVAVLYRPYQDGGKEQGDERQPFNRHLIEDRAKEIRRLPLATKLAIYLFYQGCRKALVERYPDIFDGAESESQPINTWLEMARHIPNDKFGTIQQIMQLNAGFILMHLNGTIKDAKEQERKK